MILTLKEKKAFNLLKNIPGSGLIPTSIRTSCKNKNAKEFRQMIQDLKSQAVHHHSFIATEIGKGFLELIESI